MHITGMVKISIALLLSLIADGQASSLAQPNPMFNGSDNSNERIRTMESTEEFFRRLGQKPA